MQSGSLSHKRARAEAASPFEGMGPALCETVEDSRPSRAATRASGVEENKLILHSGKDSLGSIAKQRTDMQRPGALESSTRPVPPCAPIGVLPTQPTDEGVAGLHFLYFLSLACVPIHTFIRCRKLEPCLCSSFCLRVWRYWRTLTSGVGRCRRCGCTTSFAHDRTSQRFCRWLTRE
jgi:hypothetical protein